MVPQVVQQQHELRLCHSDARQPLRSNAACGIFMLLDCLACPQRGYVRKVVPASLIKPQRRQVVGSGMARVVTPYAAGMTICALLSLIRDPAGLRAERRKRAVRLSQSWFRAPRANQVSVGHAYVNMKCLET